MNNRKKIKNTVKIKRSIFACMGVLFFFCFFGKEKVLAEIVPEWKFEVYKIDGEVYADLTEYLGKGCSQLSIPEKVRDESGNSYPVGRISNIVPEQDLQINRIDISEKIQHITLEKRCFAFLDSLKEIKIACSVTMEEGAFYGCRTLEKIEFKRGVQGYGTSMETFAGCESLTDITVFGDKIQTEGGVFDSIPQNVNLILENTLELEVKNDFSRGNINLVCYHSLFAKKNTTIVVKNGYFYDAKANVEHLRMISKGKLYGINTAPVYRENKELFVDIVAGIEVGKMRNTAFFVAKDKEREITIKDLKLVTDGKENAIKVNCYAPKGWKTIYVEMWQEEKEENDYSKGARLHCEPVKAGKVQCPIITYSGKEYRLGEILGHNSLPSGMDIELTKEAHLVEGMKEEMVAKQLLVTVFFDNGRYQEILSKEDYHLSIEGSKELIQGMENNLFIIVNKDYEITGHLGNVKAVKKQMVSGAAIYTGSTERGMGTALEGTKPDSSEISIIATYDNGETLQLNSPTVTMLFEEVVLGEKTYDILVDDFKLPVKITGVPNRIQNIEARYLDEWISVGERLAPEKIQFELVRESGKREKVSSYLVEEYQICKGENVISLSYTGNLPFAPGCERKVELVLVGATKEEIITEVFLKKEDLNILPGSIIDSSLLGVKRTFDGKMVIIENPDISILPYRLKRGENILQVQYQGEIYPLVIPIGENIPSSTKVPDVQSTGEPLENPDNSTITPPTSNPKFIGEISIAGTGKIKFQGKGKTTYQIYKKEPVTIVFSTKRIRKIQWQLVKKGNTCKDTAWKTLKGNLWSYHKNIKNCVLYIQVIDENGNLSRKKTKGFTIDLRKPTLNVVNKKSYTKGVTIQATDKGSGIKKIILNGKKIANGKKMNKKGKYQILVWDKAGNCTKKVFFLI